MELVWYLVYVFFLSGVVSFTLNRKHFLLILLSLEFLMLSLFFSLSLMLSFSAANMFLLMIYLTLAVCEGVLGLSVMVMMIRVSGNDQFSSVGSLW